MAQGRSNLKLTLCSRNPRPYLHSLFSPAGAQLPVHFQSMCVHASTLQMPSGVLLQKWYFSVYPFSRPFSRQSMLQEGLRWCSCDLLTPNGFLWAHPFHSSSWAWHLLFNAGLVERERDHNPGFSSYFFLFFLNRLNDQSCQLGELQYEALKPVPGLLNKTESIIERIWLLEFYILYVRELLPRGLCFKGSLISS